MRSYIYVGHITIQRKCYPEVSFNDVICVPILNYMLLLISAKKEFGNETKTFYGYETRSLHTAWLFKYYMVKLDKAGSDF